MTKQMLDQWEMEALDAIKVEQARIDAMMLVWSTMVSTRRGLKGMLNISPDGVITSASDPKEG